MSAFLIICIIPAVVGFVTLIKWLICDVGKDCDPEDSDTD
jgi:hypothetical protein